MSDKSAVVEERPSATEREVSQKSSAARPKRQPPYAVVLLNDDEHSFQYVVETLMKVFGYAQEKAFQLTAETHLQGRGIVWTGTRELAELKRDQIRSAGPDFYAEERVGFPLGATIEPLPQ